MTAPGLAAVCARHGLNWLREETPPEEVEARAIAVLKGRYDMATRQSADAPESWRASCEAIGPDWVGTMDAYGPTELAVVAALADRLKGDA